MRSYNDGQPGGGPLCTFSIQESDVARRRDIQKGVRGAQLVAVTYDPTLNRDWLLDLIPPSAVCAEVGVWKGGFARVLL